MVFPADVQEQIVRMADRLRWVPSTEQPPSAAVREQVRRWHDHVRQAADLIRWADDLIERVRSGSGQADVERDRVLALVRPIREQAFALMQRLNPEQAWFWTEAWQAGEREVDRHLAAGAVTTFATDEEFDAALDALDTATD